MEKFFCEPQHGFRKGVMLQHYLLGMLEKWKRQGKVYGMFFTHISKGFDCLPHELIVAKIQYVWVFIVGASADQ